MDSTSGKPAVQVTAGGTASARSFAFAFTGLKGEKGETGDTGPQGETGARGATGAAGAAGVGVSAISLTVTGGAVTGGTWTDTNSTPHEITIDGE